MSQSPTQRTERWKSVAGYEGAYEVSDFGNVRSLPRLDAAGHKLKGRMLKQAYEGDGYPVVGLCKNGKMKQWRVHRLVAVAFLEQSEKPYVNHKDGDKKNNVVDNLEWCTDMENHIHAKAAGLMARGERSGKARLTAEKVLKIRAMRSEGIVGSKIAETVGAGISAVWHVIHRRVWAWL